MRNRNVQIEKEIYHPPATLNYLQRELDDSNKEISAYKFALDEAAIVAITNSQGIIRHANKNFCRISKYSAEELIGQDHRMINSGHHPKAFFRELWSTISGGKIWKGEIKNKAKDGSFYWVDTTIIPFVDEQAGPYQFLAIRNDITKRKNAEGEISLLNRELEKKIDERILELEIANKEQQLQSKDKELKAGELLIANKELLYQNSEKKARAAELLIANKELLFQNAEKEKRAAELLIANNELLYQNSEKEKRAAELLIANKELVFRNSEKEKRAAELSVANRELHFQNREKENRSAELTAANRELKISELQFKEVNKELESFSYSVSHDLRAPLRAIHGYSKMLKTKFESQLNHEANRLVNNIVDNAKKMGQLIDDLLDFSRMNRKELTKVQINMDGMLQDICAELKKEHPTRQIEFNIKEILPGLADHITIRHVWQNLISNAVKYTGLKKFAKIEIGSGWVNNEIVYYVKDNGAGFDMRYADKLFGVFQRLHCEDEFEGTGVGLALAQRIILKHGGRIWADAEVDKGADFFFTLNENMS